MADGVDLTFNLGEIERQGDRITRRYLSVGTSAVASATKRLERSLEDATRAGVRGRLWQGWQSRTYPESGPARDPVGTVFVNGKDRSKGAMAFWTQPGEIRGRKGQYLAIPLPAAGTLGRGRNLTPTEWEARHPGVKLRFVARSGKAPLLVVDDAVLSGRRQVAKRNTDRRIATGRGNTTIPIFVLLPIVQHRHTVSLPPLLRRAEQDLAGEYMREAAKVSSRA